MNLFVDCFLAVLGIGLAALVIGWLGWASGRFFEYWRFR